MTYQSAIAAWDVKNGIMAIGNDNGKAAAYFGDAFLRLLGMSKEAIAALRKPITPRGPTEADIRALQEFTDDARGINRTLEHPGMEEFPPEPPEDSGYDGWLPPEDQYPNR